MSGHTELPWQVVLPASYAKDQDDWHIACPTHVIHSRRHRFNREDAAFIVTACNSHADLVAEVARLTELAKLQGQEISITRERDEALESSHAELVKALEEISTGCDDEHLHPFNSVWAELIKSRARAALAALTARKVTA